MSLKKHPIVHLTQLLGYHRVVTRKKYKLIAAYYLKLLAREPFRIIENIKFNNETIKNIELEEDPVFILGHWRSGTSFLQYLLAKDPQFGYLSKFQTFFPDVFLSSEKFVKPILDSIAKFIPITGAMDRISINVDWESPGELDIALTTLVSTVTPHWGHVFPQDGQKYFEKYLFFDEATDKEIAQWQRLHTYLLKKITLKHGGKQVLIKSPGNTARVEKLLELYPNAKFVYIHRNPYDVFYSNRKLWDMILDNLSFQELKQEQVDEKIFEIYSRVMQKYLTQRELIPEGNLAEIRFEEFTSEPIEVLSGVYDQLNIRGFDTAKPHFNDFLQQIDSSGPSSYEFEPEIIQMINDRWDFSLDEWSYPNPLPEPKETVAV